jgi:hypothetical protein
MGRSKYHHSHRRRNALEAALAHPKCAGCGKPSLTLYCEECAPPARERGLGSLYGDLKVTSKSCIMHRNLVRRKDKHRHTGDYE